MLTYPLMRFSFTALLIITCHYSVYSQRVHEYQLGVTGLVSSSQTPFWLRANHYGTIPLTGQQLGLVASLQSAYRLPDSLGKRPKLDWGYGGSVVINLGKTNQFLLPEAYIKARWRALELYGGRRKEIVGLVDTMLTTGAYAWSGNALPIPKIQIGLPQYTAIPFTKGVLSVMGALAHGWFENGDRLVKGSYLHQMYAYGRIGKPTWRFRLYGGFNHEVIWAGQANPGVLSSLVAVDGKLPSNIRYFPAVVLGTRNADYVNDPTITSFEDNRIGNHLGSLDLAADVNISHWNLYLYRQFPYDDGSLFYGTNLEDGLNGIRLKNRQKPTYSPFFLRQITFEYLFTGSQGGDEFVIDDPQRRGRDDYFNHSQFIDGWTYFGRTIGSPFLSPQTEVSSSLPYRYGIANNRVSAYYVGISALLFNKIDIVSRLSYSLNAGTYVIPYIDIPKQFSGLLKASMPVNLWGGAIVSGSLAVDVGGLLPNSVGAYLSIRKQGVLTSGQSKPGFRLQK